MKNYLAKLFSDATGDPSMKRYMCVVFAVAGITFAACGYGIEVVACFITAALGENVTSIFEKGHQK